ncbi:MAG: hypothetical protein Q8M24_03080 [Pseudolabrys sp.]|nr:hypothetical protein [Pseudolabrys sp.]MDP2294431.1 hypothetical protein [Pseudolabrys sp.]
MGKESKEEKLKETDKPWERPGQFSQNPSDEAPSKKDVEGTFEQVNKTS